MKILYLALTALFIQNTLVSAETHGTKNSTDTGISLAQGEKSDAEKKHTDHKEEAPPKESQP